MDIIFKLIKLVFTIYSFAKETKRVLEASNTAVDAHERESAILLRPIYNRILWLSGGFFFFGLLVIPIATPWINAWVSKSQPYDKIYDAKCRMVMAFILCLATSVIHLFGGLSLGCLLAPNYFLKSPAGKIWTDIVGGTSNTTVVRITCSLVVIASFAVMTATVWLILVMAPFKDEEPRNAQLQFNHQIDLMRDKNRVDEINERMDGTLGAEEKEQRSKEFVRTILEMNRRNAQKNASPPANP